MNTFSSDQDYQPSWRIVSTKAQAYRDDFTSAYQYMNLNLHNF